MSKFIRTCIAALLMLGSVSVSAAADSKQVELQVGDNTALADLVIPDGKSLADGVLVLTHGTLAHKDMELVENLQGLLAERGIATLAHNLTLGLDKREGMYDCAAPHTHRHEDAVDEIDAWIGWLKDQGAGSISLFGHSRGGNQVAWYAAEKPGLSKLVLLAPAMGQSADEHAAGFKKQFKADLTPLLSQSHELIEAGKGGQLIDVPGFIYCPAGKASAASSISYYGGDERQQTLSHMANIKAPVLVIAGSADTVVPDVPAKFGKVADGEKITFKLIDDAGHMFLDFYIEDAADLIAEFLDK